MKWCLVLAIAGAIGVPAASYSQQGLQNPSSQEVAPGSEPQNGKTREAESSRKPLEKAKEKIGQALEKTGETVKEALGLMKQGCLQQGNEADPYILTENDSAKETTLIGSVDLARHVGHAVRVYGEQQAGGRVFRVTKVEHVAATCDAVPREQPHTTADPGGEITADDQGMSAADRKLTQAIRKAVVQDESLSTQAKNIKIITRNGFVTLKGPVRNDAERRSIEAKAATVAGAAKVSNELSLRQTP